MHFTNASYKVEMNYKDSDASDRHVGFGNASYTLHHVDNFSEMPHQYNVHPHIMTTTLSNLRIMADDCAKIVVQYLYSCNLFAGECSRPIVIMLNYDGVLDIAKSKFGFISSSFKFYMYDYMRPNSTDGIFYICEKCLSQFVKSVWR